MLLSIKCSTRFNLLKYVSDSFEEKYEELKQDPYADEEDQDEYLAENIFWVPKEARWQYINDNAKTRNWTNY